MNQREAIRLLDILRSPVYSEYEKQVAYERLCELMTVLLPED